MLLRKWTTDTPTPHVVLMEVRPFANEVIVRVDGVVVYCGPAPFGFSAPFRHDLLIDGESWTLVEGSGFLGRGRELVRTQDAHQVLQHGRRTNSLVGTCLALLLIVLSRSPVPGAISSRLELNDRAGTFLSTAFFAIGIFGVILHLFRWWAASRHSHLMPSSSGVPQPSEVTARSVFRCLALLAISIALSIGAFNAKPIALYFVGNREMVPVLTAVLAGLSAVVFGVALIIALNPLSKAERRDTNGGRAGLLRRDSTLGTRPRSGSFFRPFLEDIRRTARRWKLGLPRFWIGRVRTDR